ncbi:MAG: L-threonylcarbamoyladenylate synthase [Thermosynechococcaceae cyanobacterium]
MPQISMAALLVAARSGHLLSFPTDTVPALAALPTAATAIYEAKQRPPEKPLILMAASSAELWPFVQGSLQDHQVWQQMAERYWPGAVTLVLPASDLVPSTVNANSHTIGLRVPQWPLAQIILQQTGPLVTTSINRSHQPPLLLLDDIQTQFPEVFVPLTWPLPPSAVPTPSTVIAWTDNQQWTVLRQGKARLL